MITVTSTPTQPEKSEGVTCQHCGQQVKLNEIIRSATHDLGCTHCIGR
jgi:DNA-directed RNA polymerase subunit RPC12/RpoP